MKKYICECCGGQINRATMKCEYCDTAYAEDNETVFRIETYKAPVETLKCATIMPREMIIRDPEMATRYALKTITHKLAESLMPYMVYTSYEEPLHQQVELSGTVKVVIPKDNDPRIVENLRRMMG